MTEEQLHKAICDYLKLKNVIFNTDLSGIKLTMGQARKLKNLRSSRAFPDIVIYKTNSKFCGMFLELKKETPFKKDGMLKSQKVTKIVKGVKVEYDHLQEQFNMIKKLREQGYYAQFVWSFNQAKDIVDNYLQIDKS